MSEELLVRLVFGTEIDIKTEKFEVKVGNRRHRLSVIYLFLFTFNFLNTGTDLE